jgi:hypothetical protein
MSNIALIPVFGTSFTVYVPIVMTLVALMTVFDVYARVLKVVGIESDDAIRNNNCLCTFWWSKRAMVPLNEEDLERFESGKKLVASALRSMAAQQSVVSTQSSTPSVSSNNLHRLGIESSMDRDRMLKNPMRSNLDEKNGLKFDFLGKKVVKESDGSQQMFVDASRQRGDISNNNFGLDDESEEQPYYGGRYSNLGRS